VLVEKVVVEGGRATAVQFRQGGEKRVAAAAARSCSPPAPSARPQILELSGIGHGDVLQRHGIPSVKEKPGVGGNLQDHLQIRAIYKVHGIKTLNETYHNLSSAA
jgi:choline dehydrogenase